MPFAQTNGIRTYYEIYGEGQPAVFIHGIAITSRVWDFQREELSKYFKMIVYDLRGSGNSDKTPWVTHTAQLLAQDLKALLEHLGISKAHIVGLSMGAAIAMKFSADYPQMVDKLILTGAFADLQGILNFIRKFFGFLIGRLLMTRFFGMLATRLMLPSVHKKELLYYHKNIIRIDRDEVKKYNQILKSYTITDALNRITAPALILYGQYEAVLHKYGRAIHRRIKNSKMVIIPRVGHGWNGEDPKLFNRIVREFLETGNALFPGQREN